MRFTIKDIVEGILLEEKDEEKPKEEKPKEEKPKEKNQKSSKVDIEASTGSGGFSKGVSEAGALAEEDPETLMKNLGVKSGISGSNDLEKIENLVKQAITGTDEMKRVYSSMSKLTKGDKKALKISVQEIKARDGVKYMYHTLVGARNAKLLDIDSLVQVENFQGDVIIYQGSKRSWG